MSQVVERHVPLRSEVEPGRPGASASLLASLFGEAREAIYSLTPDGLVLSWNTATEELYGYRAAEVLGRPSDPTVPEELEGELAERLVHLVAGSSRAERFETVRVT